MTRTCAASSWSTRREAKALEEGVALLEKAVAADPNFARAWVELSRAY